MDKRIEKGGKKCSQYCFLLCGYFACILTKGVEGITRDIYTEGLHARTLRSSECVRALQLLLFPIFFFTARVHTRPLSHERDMVFLRTVIFFWLYFRVYTVYSLPHVFLFQYSPQDKCCLYYSVIVNCSF